MAALRSIDPADDAGRAAIDGDLDRTLFVQAGAGSGKTTHLVRRVVALVSRGVPLGAIAAITFTEAAAAELRFRIRDQLERAARQADDPEQRERCRVAAADVDLAAICTLHAFAQRVLSEFPIAAGLPPRIEVLDEIRSSLTFDARLSAFLDALLGDDANRDLVLPALALRVGPRQIAQLAKVFDQNHDRLEALDWPTPGPFVADLAPLVADLDALAARRADCTDPDADNMARHLATVVGPAADHLRSVLDGPGGIEMLVDLPSLSCARGQKPNWPGGELDELRDETRAVEARRTELVAEAADRVLTHLAVRVAAATVEAAAERRRHGQLEYHDLLVLARRLLRDHPTVRRILHDRYSCLLLDEFQDTDPLQIELAVLIATDAADVQGRAWVDLPVPEGRLFFVGDAKQSIYRFRRADVGLYASAARAFAPGATSLTRNFRSVPEVIDVVNGVFADLFGEGTGSGQVEFQPLTPERTSAGPAPAVWFCGGPYPDLSAADLRVHEADVVAAMIRRALDEGWSIADGEGTRAVRPDDIGVLLPARTSLPFLEEALRAQRVPYRTETGSLVWASPEVRELLTVLAAVDDPGDEVVLVGALRSAACGCGDDDLLRYRRAGGRWSLDGPVPDVLTDDDPVVAALAAIDRLHRVRWWMDVADLVELVVRDRRLLEVAVATERPRDVWRRLRYVVDQARAFTETVGGTLRDFLSWADRQRSETSAAAAPVLPEPDDRSVRIMTIHGAKGLEFPVTVVSGLTTRPRPAVKGVHVDFRIDGPPAVTLRRGLETLDFDAVRTAEEQLDRHERLRLLYVALTRARDHLIVSTTHKPGGSSYAEQLWTWSSTRTGSYAVVDDEAGDGGGPAPPEELQAWEVAGTGAAHPLPDRAAWLATRAERLAAARPAALSATAIAHGGIGAPRGPSADGRSDERSDARADDGDARADEREDPGGASWARGRGATALGRAVHAVLQTIDLASGDGLRELAAAHAATEGVAGRTDEVESRVRAALASPVVARAAAARHWREMYIGVPLAGVVVEGFIDLLFETVAGLVVVDFKTDAVRSPNDAAAVAPRYRRQGATYALALEEHLGRPVAAAGFLFLGGADAVEVWIDDLPGAVAEVRAIAAGVPHPAPTAG